MRTRVWCTSLVLASLAVACGDQMTEVVPEREMTQGPGVIALATSSSDDGLSITTDKDDYAPGDTVIITGTGWEPGETVSLLIEEEPAADGPHLFSAVADENGDIENRDLLITELHLEVTFTLTATGLTSGLTAQTTFADHGPSPVVATNYSISANASHVVTVEVALSGAGGTTTFTAAEAKIANETAGGTVDVSLTSPGSPGNGTWSGSFEGVCGTEYKINNVMVTWNAPGGGQPAHPHSSTQTPSGTVSVTTGACAANRAPTADAGGPYEGNEGAAIPLDGTGSSDPDGDAITYKWTVDVTGIDAGGVCTFDDDTKVDAQVKCTDDSGSGTFTLTLKVTDTNGEFDTDDATLKVDNVDPVVDITAPIDWTLYQLVGGLSIPISAVFTDDGSNDTHKCKVEITKYLVTTTLLGNTTTTSPCTATLYPDEAAVYTIKVTITDDDYGSGYDEVMVIVYDPTAGFVTGGGWIMSPYGAYAADPDLIGKATLGFVSKYEKPKGSSTPTLTGNTEFVFHAAGFNFHSSSYEYLLVNANGTRAQFKGTGTVNGEAGYGFMLTALDGSTDKFRIKIWDASGTVYDNQMGKDDGGNDATALGGGSIVIHVPKK